jgi:hypothetical protein
MNISEWEILIQQGHPTHGYKTEPNRGEMSMDIRELIIGSFEDYWGRFDRALEGLTSEDLAWQPQAECNPISFIAWHMARVEDRFLHHFAKGTEEVWVRNNWYTQFGLEPTDHIQPPLGPVRGSHP